MTDEQIIDDVHILYICSYGQSALPICVDLEHRYCNLKSQKSKKCNLRPVVSYKEYKRKAQECEELKRRITKIFACLIKANRTNKIVDTLWVDSITTLWDYIALTLGLEGDQTQVEKQILQKISEVDNAR